MSQEIVVVTTDDPKAAGKRAEKFGVGEFFRDADDDLFIRVSGGALYLSSLENLVVYSDEELADLDSRPFFEHCTPARDVEEVRITFRSNDQ